MHLVLLFHLLLIANVKEKTIFLNLTRLEKKWNLNHNGVGSKMFVVTYFGNPQKQKNKNKIKKWENPKNSKMLEEYIYRFS